MGHSGCGAIQATLDKELTGKELPSESLNALVDKLCSPVRETIKNNETSKNLVNDAAKQNVQHTIENLLKITIIQKAIKNKEVEIAGTFYILETGKVEFL